MITQLTFIHALSPLHAGIGQGVGVIDLPVAREKATGLPFLPGSSLKGTLRSLCNDDDCDSIFGSKLSSTDADSNFASSVQFSDQRLLLLPVRSLAGTFAWVTSPYVLRRLLRDIADTQSDGPTSIPDVEDQDCCVCSGDEKERSQLVVTPSNTVYLEDLDLNARKEQSAKDWAEWIGQRVFKDHEWQQLFIQRFCIVHDDVFSFLLETATEITARIKLQEESKTVQTGGLWYEEALPTETILTGLAMIAPTRAANRDDGWISDKLEKLTGKTVQFGGKATVGRGLCRVYFSKSAKGSQ